MGRVAPAHAPPAPSLLINAPATGDCETRINTAALNLMPALVALSQPLLQGHWGLEGQWADVLPPPARWGCSQRVSSKPATLPPCPGPRGTCSHTRQMHCDEHPQSTELGARLKVSFAPGIAHFKGRTW